MRGNTAGNNSVNDILFLLPELFWWSLTAPSSWKVSNQKTRGICKLHPVASFVLGRILLLRLKSNASLIIEGDFRRVSEIYLLGINKIQLPS